MKQKVILDIELSPARVDWNSLELDRDAPLVAQLEELRDDMLAAKFENGCRLVVGWLPESCPEGSFRVELNANPDVWLPFVVATCRTLSELRRIVLAVAEVARQRRLVHVISADEISADPWLNDIVFDPQVPLEDQVDLLKGTLFDAFIGVWSLSVGWSQPYSPAGEFIVTLRREPASEPARDVDSLTQRRHCFTNWPVVHQVRCRSLDDLRRTVIEFSTMARRAAAG